MIYGFTLRIIAAVINLWRIQQGRTGEMREEWSEVSSLRCITNMLKVRLFVLAKSALRILRKIVTFI